MCGRLVRFPLPKRRVRARPQPGNQPYAFFDFGRLRVGYRKPVRGEIRTTPDCLVRMGRSVRKRINPYRHTKCRLNPIGFRRHCHFNCFYDYSGRICGNRITSRMVCESVSNITKRSIPMPQPPVGGKPNSIARM